MSRPLNLSYDEVKDILSVEGVKYSGEFFRCFAIPDETALYRIVKEDGVVTVVECHVDSRKLPGNSA